MNLYRLFSMKLKCALLFSTFLLLPTLVTAAPRPLPTANYYRTYGQEFVDQTITLDVSFLHAPRGQSPLPGYHFLQAVTFDRSGKMPGGDILLVVPEALYASTLKKYGTTADGERLRGKLDDTRKLSGTLRVGPRGMFYIDLDGTAAAAMKAMRPEELEGVLGGGGLDGHPRGPRGQ